MSAPPGICPPNRLANCETPSFWSSLFVKGDVQVNCVIFSRLSHTLPACGRFTEESGAHAADRDPVVSAIAALLGTLGVHRSVADVLIVQIEADLVARRGLSGQSDRLDHLRSGAARRQALVTLVEPL